MSIKNFYSIIILLLVLARTFAQQPDLVSNQDVIGTGTDAFTYVPPPSSFQEGIRTATFDITYNGFTQQAMDAFQYASDIWSSILVSDVTIKINAYMAPLPNGTLGITFPNGRKDFSGAAFPNTWYSTTLANKISGTELNPGETDMDLLLTTSANWYFGTDGNCPAGKYDFVSIVLHEMCHGLGFVGLSKVVNDTGSFGLLTSADFGGISTSFPWPDLDTLPSVFDLWLVNSASYQLYFDTPGWNPSAGLGVLMTCNFVYWSGNFGGLYNNNVKPRIFAPTTFALGSSLVHLNESTFPAGNINELMTPFSGTADAVHDPGPVTVGILKDIGWEVNYSVGIEEANSENGIIIFPNPAENKLQVQSSLPGIDIIEITNSLGQQVYQSLLPEESIDISELPAGIYLLKIYSDEKEYFGKFVKQ